MTERPIGDTEYDNGKPRTESDLDSITVGSPSKAQVKIYLNSKKDTQEETEIRISWLVSCAKYLADEMKKGGLR